MSDIVAIEGSIGGGRARESAADTAARVMKLRTDAALRCFSAPRAD